jgi:hypothetical protein
MRHRVTTSIVRSRVIEVSTVGDRSLPIGDIRAVHECGFGEL